MSKLAYYTCYFGGINNYSRLIPPIPSLKNDCYFFTNDTEIYNSLENTGWKRVLLDNPIHDCDIKDSMESKLIRCCPYLFIQLKGYEYLCWFDTKLKVYENKIDGLVDILSKGDKCIVLTKHPYSSKFNTVWDEFNLAMESDKYRAQYQQYIDYIKKQIGSGFSEEINIHFCGGWNLRKMCKRVEEFGDMWYSHIQECGIEDQISLQFVQQKFIDYIIPLEYQETWKYHYEE